MAEIAEGDGPKGAFDAQHLKAIHGRIFQDIYEWAGRTRDESPAVDGQKVEPIGNLSKGGTSFLHGSRIEMGLDEAFRPIRKREILRGSSAEQFAEIAGKVLAELNYVHPFREGNGRAQEALLASIGREYGHEVDFTVITKARMIEASIAPTFQSGCTMTIPKSHSRLVLTFPACRVRIRSGLHMIPLSSECHQSRKAPRTRPGLRSCRRKSSPSGIPTTANDKRCNPLRREPVRSLR